MKSKAIIPLAVGLAVGLIAIKLTMDTVRKARGSTQNTEHVSVVVARQDIPSTAAITPEMLLVQQTPRTPLLPRDAFTKIEELTGRVALKSIPQGAPVLPSMIAPEGTVPGLIVRVKEGYRAVAVKIDESSGVGYLVKPNDWVDVLAVMEVTRNGKKETVSQLVLERVQVGAVGQVLSDAPSGETTTQQNTRVQTVTLIVKVEDVPKLHLAQTRGRITLAMRGADDLTITHKTTPEEEKTGPAPLKGPELLATLWKKAAEAPTPTPTPTPVVKPKTYTVTVVNGSAGQKGEGQVEVVTFKGDDSMETVGEDEGADSVPTNWMPSSPSSGRTYPGATPDVADENETYQAGSNEVHE